MTSSSLAYHLPTFTGHTSHGWHSGLLRDGFEQKHPDLKLEAQVRSGDYFITLATFLDTIARELTDHQAQMRLEDMVSDLIYLQDNYDIERRKER
jgi:hypothetical protein